MIQVTAQAGHRTGIMKNTGGVLRKNLGEKLSLTQAVSDLLNPRITIFRVLDISCFVTNRTRKAKIRRRWARSDLDLVSPAGLEPAETLMNKEQYSTNENYSQLT